MSVSIKRIGPEPPTLNREYKKRPKPVSGYGRYIKTLPCNYKPAPTYEIPPEDPERRKRIVEGQRKYREAQKAKEQAEKPKRKPSQNNRVWTDERIAQLKALYAEGKSYPAIAKVMGMKPSQINAEAYYLQELGEVEKRLALNAWSDEEVERLHKLRKQGLSVAKCAKALHRSVGSVDSRLRREAEKQ